MIDSKKIALAHIEKKLFFKSNSIVYLQRKHQEIKAPETAWNALDAA